MKNHVANLVAGLTEQGHQVFVAGGQTDVDWRGANLPLSANPIQFWSCTYILSSLITELAPDVVHFHGALAALLALTVPKDRGSVWIYTAHNFPAGVTSCLCRSSQLTKKMDRVIAVSKSLATALIAQGIPEEKITVVYNGIDLERFKPQPLDVFLRTPLFLSIGRLVPEKGFTFLLEAMAQVKAIGWPHVRLVIVGDGPSRSQLENLARRLNIAAAVEFVGHKTEPGRLLEEAFALVTPSVREGLGLVNIEAMAMGRPVISTWAGGIPEVVVHGGTGLLVPPKMPGALAMAMMFLLQYPEIAKQLGMAASERAHSHFSAAATTSSTLRVYREALEA